VRSGLTCNMTVGRGLEAIRVHEGAFPVCGIALASSRLGASILIPADHAQEHGQSKNWPATLIGINKVI
jgi:hypothetical protein